MTKQPQPRGSVAWLTAAHWTCLALFLALLGLVAAEAAAAIHLPENSGWPEAALLLAATASILISLCRELPGQNVFWAAVIIALISGFAQAVGARTGIPFGPYFYTRAAGPRVLDTLPWWIPLIWVVTILNSRGVARLILRPWRKTRRYGFWLIGLTAALALVFDLGLEPFATRVKSYWLWSPTKLGLSWYGAPVIDSLGWAVTTVLILAFITPFLINKNPVKHPPDFHPLVLWVLLNLLFVANAAGHRFWPAAVFSSVAVLFAAIFAARGAKG
jgi:uncharacterized membrane protein